MSAATMKPHGWIEKSLQRLDELEAARERAITFPGTERLVADLTAEIDALYDVLEDAAENPDIEAVPPSAISTMAAPVERTDVATVATPPVAAVAPACAAVSASAPVIADTYASMRADAFDRPRRWWPIALASATVTAVMLLGGVGLVRNAEAQPPATTEPSEPTVILAAAVPPDTQEPAIPRAAAIDPVAGAANKHAKTGKKGRDAKKGSKRRATKRKAPVSFDAARDPLAGM